MNNPSFNCGKVADRPSLSGDLAQPPWSGMQPVGELVLAEGNGKPRFGTRVWCCWHDVRFYVAFDCEDTDIRATLTERDDKVWQEEAVEFFVNTDSNLKKYYEFQLNPRSRWSACWGRAGGGKSGRCGGSTSFESIAGQRSSLARFHPPSWSRGSSTFQSISPT